MAQTAAAATATLQCVDVLGNPVHDPDTEIKIVKPGESSARFRALLKLEGKPMNLTFDATGGGNFVLSVDTDRYSLNGRFINPGDDVTLKLLRKFKKWSAKFTAWNRLSNAGFSGLKTILKRSNQVSIKKTGVQLGNIAGPAFDAITDEHGVLAKASLLNLNHRMHLPEPFGNQPWGSFVIEILQIDRERVIAKAKPDFYNVVKAISDDLLKPEVKMFGYEKTAAQNHRGNVPAEFRPKISEMVSVKTDHNFANLQLTAARLAGIEDFVIMDVDIDENGALLAHMIDALFVHRITGGTHPFQVHDLLLDQDHGADLGYTLV